MNVNSNNHNISRSSQMYRVEVPKLNGTQKNSSDSTSSESSHRKIRFESPNANRSRDNNLGSRTNTSIKSLKKVIAQINERSDAHSSNLLPQANENKELLSVYSKLEEEYIKSFVDEQLDSKSVRTKRTGRHLFANRSLAQGNKSLHTSNSNEESENRITKLKNKGSDMLTGLLSNP